MAADRPTFAQWLEMRADRLVRLGLSAPEEHREDYMKVQARSLARDAVNFARSGLGDDDLMPPISPDQFH
jgi:hypothetical protein